MKRRFLCVYLPLWAIERWILERKSNKPSLQNGSADTRDRNTQHAHEPVTDRREGFPYALRCDFPGHQPLVLYRAPLVSKLTNDTRTAHQSERLASGPHSHATVAHACACALRAGVKRGMALTLAQALCPSPPLVAPAQPERDVAWLYRLARWALKFSPLVALDTELILAVQQHSLADLSPQHFCFTIDLTGTDRTHGGEHLVLKRLERALSSRLVSARYAIAPTAGASWACAHFGNSKFITIEDAPDNATTIERQIAALPIEALRLIDADARGLRALGIVSIGELQKLPLSKLSIRFPHVQRPQGILTRIRQALGTQHEVLTFIHPKTSISSQRVFEIPLSSHAAIGIIVLELLEDVFRKLAFERKNTRSIIIELRGHTPDRLATTLRKELTLCHATRDSTHARSVISPLIESLRDVEGITHLLVVARLTTSASPQQASLVAIADHSTLEHSEQHSEQHSKQCAGELLNHLLARCGKDRVLTVARHESYLPENSFSYRSVLELPSRPAKSFASSAPFPQGAAAIHPALGRPSYLFERPEQASAIAMLPDRPPSQLLWNGERLKIIAAQGPERICLEWWHHSLSSCEAQLRPLNSNRDYFKLQDQTGRWLWVYRDNGSSPVCSPPESQWFVHGMWI